MLQKTKSSVEQSLFGEDENFSRALELEMILK